MIDVQTRGVGRAGIGIGRPVATAYGIPVVGTGLGHGLTGPENWLIALPRAGGAIEQVSAGIVRAVCQTIILNHALSKMGYTGS